MDFTHLPTDYFRGTIMEPETTSKLKASFGEYEELGKRHKQVSDRIANLQEAMKVSRQNGAFQALQKQMKEIKELVKQKEDLDGKMAVADLARKKDDDHRLAVKQEVSYSEQLGTVSEKIQELESLMFEFSEEYDFARCQRADGSFYGTRGKCKKGKDAGAAPVSAPQARAAKAVSAPRKETLDETRERMAANREAYLREKKAASKKGPLHKEVSEARDRVKEQMGEVKNRKSELDRLSRAYFAMEKKVKQEPSKENKERYKLVRSALIEQERAFRRSEKEAERLARQWRALNKKNERAMMTPAQRASERALDRQIKLMG